MTRSVGLCLAPGQCLCGIHNVFDQIFSRSARWDHKPFNFDGWGSFKIKTYPRFPSMTIMNYLTDISINLPNSLSVSAGRTQLLLLWLCQSPTLSVFLHPTWEINGLRLSVVCRNFSLPEMKLTSGIWWLVIYLHNYFKSLSTDLLTVMKIGNENGSGIFVSLMSALLFLLYLCPNFEFFDKI